MPRKKREKSGLGIYHVMLRGINKQDIFFNEDDFLHVMKFLQGISFKKDKATEKILSSNLCTIYSYCILHNHLHLLIKEGEETISEIVKRIEVSYALYYNKKYERVGPMFQGRFESEPVNDESYFHTVFRYIARNPVKAMESPSADVYPYSSWNEYVGNKSNLIKVIKPVTINEVKEKYPIEELSAWINQDNQDKCMDMDSFINVKSDKEAWDIVSDLSHLENPEDFRLLDQQTQIYYLLQATEKGVNISQAARIGTLSRFQMTKAYKKKFGESLAKGSGTDASLNLENSEKRYVYGDQAPECIHQEIRRIPALGKRLYQRLHLIVEYLYVNEQCKCAEIAESLNISNESIRQSLMLLSNQNIVDVVGNGKSRFYKINANFVENKINLEND